MSLWGNACFPPLVLTEVPLSYAAKIFSYSQSANIVAASLVAAAAIDCSLLIEGTPLRPSRLPLPLPLSCRCLCSPWHLLPLVQPLPLPLPLPVGCCFAFWWLQINHTLNMAITFRAPQQAQAQAQSGSDREVRQPSGALELQNCGARRRTARQIRLRMQSLLSRCRAMPVSKRSATTTSAACLHWEKILRLNYVTKVLIKVMLLK